MPVFLFVFVCLVLGFFCGTRASHRCGLSRCGAQAPDAQAQRPWLTGLAARRMWDPPGPGLEPVSPASAGGLSTTAPPGKPVCINVFVHYSVSCTSQKSEDLKDRRAVIVNLRLVYLEE